VLYRVDAPHWFLTRLLLDDVGYETGSACNHENAVERMSKFNRVICFLGCMAQNAVYQTGSGN